LVDYREIQREIDRQLEDCVMSGDITTKLTRRVMIAGLLVAGSFWFAKQPTRAFLMSQEAGLGEQVPNITITSPQAPLQILSTWVANTTPQDFRLVLQVQNQSGKGIRAFAINSQVATGKRQNEHSQFENLTQQSSVWQPTQIRSIEVSDSLEDQIRSVRLTVDFIEFTDGTTWGSDSENSRDLLKGQREGAKFERQRLRDLMKAKGFQALADDLRSEQGTPESSAATGRSVKWQAGFRNGVSAVRRRVRDVLASGNQDQITAELNRPFDTAEKAVSK